MNSSYSIAALADFPQYIEACASWLYADRSHYYPQETKADALEAVRSCLNRGSIPFALVVHDGSQAMGTIFLVKKDAPPAFHQLTPWLTSPLIAPQFRGQGLEAALQSRAIAEAKALGCVELFHWTEDEKEWYQQQGWQLVGTTIFGRRYVVALRLDLTSASRS